MQEIPRQPMTELIQGVVDAHVPREEIAPGSTAHKSFEIPQEIRDDPYRIPRNAEGWTMAHVARHRVEDPRHDGSEGPRDVYLLSAGPSELAERRRFHTNPPAAVARTGDDPTLYMSEGRLTNRGQLRKDDLAPVEQHVIRQAQDRTGTFPLDPENYIMLGLQAVGELIEAGRLPEIPRTDAYNIGLPEEIHELSGRIEPLPPTTPLSEEITDPTQE